jgi:hypothetical protein
MYVNRGPACPNINSVAHSQLSVLSDLAHHRTGHAALHAVLERRITHGTPMHEVLSPILTANESEPFI